MRAALRRTLDDLWLVDLEGDRRAARSSDNVFPIRTPVAVAVGVRYGPAQPAQPANVHYARLSGDRPAKLAALAITRSLTDLRWTSAEPGWTAPLVPAPRGVYERWPLLTDLFPWQISGAQLKRTWPIGPTAEVLRERWHRLLQLDPAERAVAFGPTRDRGLDSAPADLRVPEARLTPLRALSAEEACREPIRYAYRSFDRHWVLPDARLGDFMRPALWRVAGPRQLFLTSLLTNVLGPGPAAVATALVPDLDHFRGSFGARAVIPLWRDAAASQPNVADGCLSARSERYGCEVGAQDLLAYCYAVLGGRGYVQRFAEELRRPGPRLPLTPDATLFARAASVGQQLLDLHSYRRITPGAARSTVPIGAVWPRAFAYDERRSRLSVGEGALEPITPAVWGYAVSGMRVLASWLRRRIQPRAGRSVLDALRPTVWTPRLTEELLELIWLLEATLELEPRLDEVLAELVSSSGHQTV
jgi:hypothetical protein